MNHRLYPLKIWPHISNSQNNFLNKGSFPLAFQEVKAPLNDDHLSKPWFYHSSQMIISSSEWFVVRSLEASNQKLHEVARHKGY